MRRILIGLLVAAMVVSVSFAASAKDEAAVKIREMKAQGLYDAQLWDEFYGVGEAPVDNPLTGGETIGTATVIGALPYVDFGNTCVAVNDYDEACPYTGSTSPDLVYSFTPAANMVVNVDLCWPGTLYDTKLYLYENAYTPGFYFACNDDWCPGYVSQLNGLSLTGGNTYYIVIDGYGGDCGDYELHVTEYVPPPPGGETCATAIGVTIPADLPYSDVGQTTCGKLDDYYNTCLGSYDEGEDILYELTVTTAIDLNIEAFAASYMYIGMAVSATCPPGLTCLYMSQNYTSPYRLSQIHLEPGMYWLMIDTWPSPDCIPTFDLSITQYIPPPPPPPCGGPDCGGYYWANNLPDPLNECLSQPFYNWVVNTDNTLLLGDDQLSGPYPIGFPFTFYGITYTNFWVCSNGFISLDGLSGSPYTNGPIPSSSSPNNIVALFWDDLNPGMMDPIYYGNTTYYGGSALVVTFYGVHSYSGPGTLTAQAILMANGNVKFQYQAFDGGFVTTSSTVGIEGPGGACGTAYLYNDAQHPMPAGLAVEFGTLEERLPVELTSFEGVAMNEAVRLTWTTASETDNDHFVLSRSTSEGGQYTQIATVSGVGESANESNYSYVDRNLINGATYYYRLADVDINGNVTNHDITVHATPSAGALGVVVSSYDLHQNYPNPFNPTTTIVYDVKETGHVTLVVYNTIGQEVATLVDEVKDNNRYQVTFDASGLAAGVYFYRLNVNDFSEVAKMVILK